jgi:hypothetical protein
MTRLPQPGADAGQWGQILNDYLEQSHNTDGTLKTDTVGALQLKPSSVTNASLADGTVQEAKLHADVQTKLNATPTVADGSITTAKIADGVVTTSKLADDAVTAAKIAGLGAPNGIASLDGDARLPESQVPERLTADELSADFVSQAEASLRALGTLDLTGVTDMSVLLQAAIAATPTYGTLYLPQGYFRIDSTLVIDRPMRVEGVGCYAISKSYATGGGFDSPNVAPHFGGTVLTVGATATDAIRITVTANSVDLKNFGIRFDAGRDTNTGHGIVAQSSIAYLGGSEHGLFHSTWENVQVFGHDGSHYAFKAVNPLHLRIVQLRSFGGGGFHWKTDSFAGNYGNTTFDSPFVYLYNTGTAHGYLMEGRTSSDTSGVLNFITLIRPQANSTGSTGSQYLFLGKVGSVSVNNLSVIGPDFESPSTGSPLEFGDGNAFIDPSGIFGKWDDTNSQDFNIMRGPLSTSRFLTSRMQLKGGDGSTPSIVPLVAAGSTATVTLAEGSSDMAGRITLTTNGTGRVAGAQARFAWSTLAGATAILLTPASEWVIPKQPYVTNIDGNGFDLGLVIAGDGPGGYEIYYQVIP